MKAIVFSAFHTFPTIEEVEKPKPGPGEVLIKVAGAGACHSDVAVYHDFDASMPAAALFQPKFVLGHENAGWVEECGEGVTGFKKGDAYVIYGPIGCGHCRACSRGQDTYCENAGEVGYLAAGLGRNGGMAEYLVVPARNLVPLGDADPVDAAPLADAGLTPYHAIKNSLDKLEKGGATAVVIGLGGLGQLAVQMLAAMTSAKIIAPDTKPDAMKKAAAYGAITVPGGPDQAAKIRELTGGKGADVVFDFVGVTPTVELSMAVVGMKGRITIVGVAGGPATWSFYGVPYESELTNTYWGTIEDLYEVVDLYKAGLLKPEVERFTFDTGLEMYRRLEAGEMSGRGVLVPNA